MKLSIRVAEEGRTLVGSALVVCILNADYESRKSYLDLEFTRRLQLKSPVIIRRGDITESCNNFQKVHFFYKE
jgi:hypothetical protein